MSASQKFSRVIVEMASGRVWEFTGEAAEELRKRLQYASDMARAHGSEFTRQPWDDIERELISVGGTVEVEP
jgi:hypothetical protein